MSASIERLRAEIRSDRTSIGRWLDQLEPLELGAGSDPALLSLAAWAIHHSYSAIEAILERTMRVIERSLPEGADFHKALLDAAALELEGIRPPLLSPETVRELHELRGFRHFVRHAYSVDLDGGRLAALQERAAGLRPVLDRELDDLDRWLAELSASLDA